MPHATPQLDWDLAQAITTRLFAVRARGPFQLCAEQNDGVEARPSRLDRPACRSRAAAAAGVDRPAQPRCRSQSPLRTSAGFPSLRRQSPRRRKRPHSQSQCPFKAFATARLAAQSWEPAEAGLTASQRGSFSTQCSTPSGPVRQTAFAP